MTAPPETLRERRRRETREHIAEVGLRMFDEHGYDATTMQAIAQASGISPRTLFHYFATKDQILRHWLTTEFADELRTTLLDQPADQPPLLAARTCLTRLAQRYETPRSLVVDRVLNSTDTLRASKQITFLEWENALDDALREKWPAPGLAPRLRTVAMAAIGALRLALERRRTRDAGWQGTLADEVSHQFDLLAEISTAGTTP